MSRVRSTGATETLCVLASRLFDSFPDSGSAEKSVQTTFPATRPHTRPLVGGGGRTAAESGGLAIDLVWASWSVKRLGGDGLAVGLPMGAIVRPIRE